MLEFCSSLNSVCIAVLETEYTNTDIFTMPLKLCSIFINRSNKINTVKTATVLFKCKYNLESSQCKDYKTNIKVFILLLA